MSTPRSISSTVSARSTSTRLLGRFAFVVLVVLVVLGLFVGTAPADTAATDTAATDTAATDTAKTDAATTFEGEFVWSSQRERGDLEATFVPAGEGEWTVEFRFRWNGQPKVFRGTATGSLRDGALRGTVHNETERRTWTFEGTFEDGVFRGEHEELKRGRSIDTGTLTLR